MKFFWKIFLAFTLLIAVVFSVFGIWIISMAFQTSFEREVEEANKENRMFQYAFEVSMNSLPATYQKSDIIAQMAEKIVDNLDNKQYRYTVFEGNTHAIYSSKSLEETEPIHNIYSILLDGNDCGYEVVAYGDKRILYFVCRTEVGGKSYYLESSKNITGIYEERESLYDSYRVVMLGILVCTTGIIFVISHLLTKTIVSLSVSTRRFAKGEYQVRADVVGEDEVAMLASDFNQMAENLVDKMDELTDAVRKQEDFTASFAHELKTPLTSIIGYSEMLRTMDMNKEETIEAANYIYSQGKRLESLSFKLLDLMVAERQKYDFRAIQVGRFIQEVKVIVEPSLHKKSITLHTQMEKGILWGEKDLLISLFTNLIDNSRKALEEGGHIWVRGKKLKTAYEVTFTDNGCGMPKEEINKITEAFYMVDKSRARKEGGAGLGMTLCSKIIAAHGAEWTIKSKEGEGTVIWVLFPNVEPGKE